jgi:hypothetical protein
VKHQKSGRDRLIAPARFGTGYGSAIGENQQDEHEREQPTGDRKQPAHVRSDVGKLLLTSQLNSAGSWWCDAPAGASGGGQERRLSFSWGARWLNRHGLAG